MRKHGEHHAITEHGPQHRNGSTLMDMKLTADLSF